MTLTPKQEKFAQAWYTTGNKSEAYRLSYSARNMSDSAINEESYRLSLHPEIALRYEELQKAAQSRNDTTVDTLDAMFKEAFEVGRGIKNPSAMVAAASGLAKLHGLNAPDKIQTEHRFLESDYLQEVQKNLK